MARIPKAKPCPFCRSADTFVERMDISSWQVVCNDCFAHGPNFCHADFDDDKAEAAAVRLWNRRRRARRAEGHKP